VTLIKQSERAKFDGFINTFQKKMDYWNY